MEAAETTGAAPAAAAAPTTTSPPSVAPAPSSLTSPAAAGAGTDEQQMDNVLDRLGVRHVDEEVVASEVIQKAQARWAAIAAKRPRKAAPKASAETEDGGGASTTDATTQASAASSSAGSATTKAKAKKKRPRPPETQDEEDAFLDDWNATGGEEEEDEGLEGDEQGHHSKRPAVNELLGESNQVRFGDLTPFEEQRLAEEQKAAARAEKDKPSRKQSTKEAGEAALVARKRSLPPPPPPPRPPRQEEADEEQRRPKEKKKKQKKKKAQAAAALSPAKDGTVSSTPRDSATPLKSGGGGDDVGLDDEHTVQCPMCQRGVPVKNKDSPDAELSLHLDRCMRTSRRSTTFKKEEEEDSDVEIVVPQPASSASRSGTRAKEEEDGMDFVNEESSSSSDASSDEEPQQGGRGKARKKPKKKTEAPQPKEWKQRARGSLLVDDFADADFRRRRDAYEEGLREMGADSDEEEEEEEEEEDEQRQSPTGRPPAAPGSRAAQATARRQGVGADEEVGPLELPGGFYLPARINRKLYWYQRTGVRWMWELYRQGGGGILGDEMGLGKTVQLSTFLSGLHRSGRLRSGALIVAPATLMSHWASELYAWAPCLRVVVLHRSAAAFAAQPAHKVGRFVRRVLGLGDGLVCITTYESLKLLRKELLSHAWSYVALDEGQTIRNPDADVTVCAKQLPTVHRLILSGTPIQNNLRELWSLFDFCFPGRLGTLPAFETELAIPIRLGGYSNATPTQAQLAYRCALVLRDLIHPYLLRRMKKDIMQILPMPKKTEQVLFCKLTARQRALYRAAVSSPEIRLILEGKASHFRAITVLRKICNHADLVAGPNAEGADIMARIVANGGWDDEWRDEVEVEEGDEEEEEGAAILPSAAKKALSSGPSAADYGAVSRSGKLQVLAEVLPRWERQGHRVLLFSQTRQMLDILERLVQNRGWRYLRMDGNTHVGARPALIERFNTDDSVFVFLLTTRTGGLGISLTGANRVVLFDPDWNPQTDIQARERAWRLGQKRAVTIYRLVTTGTIEEKIYQRQIFKTAITNRVLQDPKQKRLFSSGELKELFTLKEDFNDEEAPNDTTMEFMEGVIKRSSLNNKKKKKNKNGERKRRRRQETAEEEEGELREDDDEGSMGVLVEKEEEEEEEQARAQQEEDEEEDGKILKAVFDGRGLASVLSHDVVEEGKKNMDLWVQMQDRAKRIADQAAVALRESAALVQATQQQNNRFAPTWTGRTGSVGNASLLPRFGPRGGTAGASGASTSTSTSTSHHAPGDNRVLFGGQAAAPASSTDILSRFREREGGGSGGGGGPAEARYVSLLERIKKFLREKGPHVPTDQLLHHFRHVPHTDAVIFKTMLKSVGTLSRGTWSLTPEAERGRGGGGGSR